MRTELAPFENETVSVIGRIKEWRKNRAEGTEDICISGARVARWDAMSPLDPDACDAKVHHLWIRIPKGLCDSQLLSKVHFIGRVGWYTRSDGSVDLGIRAMKAICMDLLAKRIAEWRRSGSWTFDEFAEGDQLIEEIDFCLAALYHQGEGGYAYSWAHDCLDACKRLLRFKQQIARFLEANRSRACPLNRGKPRGLDPLPKRSKSRCSTSQAAGFA
jgi:hypothetical protein